MSGVEGDREDQMDKILGNWSSGGKQEKDYWLTQSPIFQSPVAHSLLSADDNMTCPATLQAGEVIATPGRTIRKQRKTVSGKLNYHINTCLVENTARSQKKLKRPNILSLLIATKDQAWEVLNQQYKNHDTAYGTKRMFIFLKNLNVLLLLPCNLQSVAMLRVVAVSNHLNDTLWFEKYCYTILLIDP
ncbi:hypothetical protein ACJX0J_031690 [Zea mays]